LEQNVAVAACSNPQAGQVCCSGAPQVLQKRAPPGLSAPQDAQTSSTPASLRGVRQLDHGRKERDSRSFPRKEKAVTHAKEILETHPRGSAIEAEVLVACIDACFDCAQSCTACADADLAEDDVATMIRCIRLCLDCTDVCIATGQVLSRQTEFDPDLGRALVQACLQACRSCAEECERHAAHHEHCRICAEVCRRCEQTCVDVLALLVA
jgi:hypothetical protein